MARTPSAQALTAAIGNGVDIVRSKTDTGVEYNGSGGEGRVRMAYVNTVA